ncbi:MAG: nucleotidyltransferase family protein [Opitutaceae bacterium]|nr:nucleotidyltransferase family protein [Opitutaceae bacterium]
MQAIPSPRSMDLSEVQATLKALRPELARRGVRHLWLFGSRARQEARPGSDWDLLVEFNQPPGLEDYMNMKFWLEEQLGGTVDLVSRSACKPRFIAAIQDELLDVA